MKIGKLCAIPLLCAILLMPLTACKGRKKNPPEDQTTTNADVTTVTNPSQDPESANTDKLRVMSFNVRASYLNTTEEINRAAALKKEIENYNPDLIGLSEDNEAWTEYLFLEAYEPLYDPSVTGLYGERCAIYVKKSRASIWDYGYRWLNADGEGAGVALTIADITGNGKYALTADELARLQLSASSEDSELRQGRTTYIDNDGNEQTTSSYNYLSRRRMTWAVLDVNGQKVIFVATHFQHRSQNAVYISDALLKLRNYERLAQFDLVQAQIEELKQTYTDAVVIITGDFNDVQNSDIYNTVSALYNDSFRVAEITVGQPGTWNDNFGKEYSASGTTYSNTTLDYCFVSKDRVTVDSFRSGLGYAEVTVDGETKTIYTSDHRPIISDIRFETPGIPHTSTKTLLLPGYPNDGIFVPQLPQLPLVTLQNPGTSTGTVSVYSGTPDTTWYTNEGTEFTLTTADQLMGFASLCATKTFKDITIKLGVNMVINEGTSAEILANDSRYVWEVPEFEGEFNGDGYYISGMYSAKGMFTKSTGRLYNFSLVNSVVNATQLGAGTVVGEKGVGELLLVNVYVNGTVKSTEGAVGGLIGTSPLMEKNGQILVIKNCTFTGTVESTGATAQSVGGIIGYVGANLNLTIDSCKVDADVIGQYYYAGGIIGLATKSTAWTPSFTVSVKNCAVEGTVSGMRGVGGIGGSVTFMDRFNLESCAIFADLTATEQHIGGLIGRLGNTKKPTIKDCFYQGKIQGGSNLNGSSGCLGWVNWCEKAIDVNNVVVVLSADSVCSCVFGSYINGGYFAPIFTNVWYDSTVYNVADPVLFAPSTDVNKPQSTGTEGTYGGKTTEALQSQEMATLLGDQWSFVEGSYVVPTATLSGVGADMA